MLSGHKWPSSVEQYRKINLDDQRNKINQFHPLNTIN